MKLVRGDKGAGIWLGGMGVVLAGVACAGVAVAQDEGPKRYGFSDFPDAVITYYEVGGSNPSKLRKQINELRPTNPRNGKRHDAFASYKFRWKLRPGHDGNCDALVELQMAVTFPRLSPDAKLKPKDRERWNVYISALEEHEAGHLVLARIAKSEIEQALTSGPCEGARERAQQVLALMREKQAEYDTATRHGMATGAMFP